MASLTTHNSQYHGICYGMLLCHIAIVCMPLLEYVHVYTCVLEYCAGNRYACYWTCVSSRMHGAWLSWLCCCVAVLPSPHACTVCYRSSPCTCTLKYSSSSCEYTTCTGTRVLEVHPDVYCTHCKFVWLLLNFKCRQQEFVEI